MIANILLLTLMAPFLATGLPGPVPADSVATATVDSHAAAASRLQTIQSNPFRDADAVPSEVNSLELLLSEWEHKQLHAGMFLPACDEIRFAWGSRFRLLRVAEDDATGSSLTSLQSVILLI